MNYDSYPSLNNIKTLNNPKVDLSIDMLMKILIKENDKNTLN